MQDAFLISGLPNLVYSFSSLLIFILSVQHILVVWTGVNERESKRKKRDIPLTSAFFLLIVASIAVFSFSFWPVYLQSERVVRANVSDGG